MKEKFIGFKTIWFAIFIEAVFDEKPRPETVPDSVEVLEEKDFWIWLGKQSFYNLQAYRKACFSLMKAIERAPRNEWPK